MTAINPRFVQRQDRQIELNIIPSKRKINERWIIPQKAKVSAFSKVGLYSQLPQYGAIAYVDLSNSGASYKNPKRIQTLMRMKRAKALNQEDDILEAIKTVHRIMPSVAPDKISFTELTILTQEKTIKLLLLLFYKDGTTRKQFKLMASDIVSYSFKF